MHPPLTSQPQNATWSPRSKGCAVVINDTIVVS
jgi:hypothetical protein